MASLDTRPAASSLPERAAATMANVMGIKNENILDQIKRDHQELREFYDEYQRASSPEESRKWFNQFVWELARHSVGEELILYPMMESINERGKTLADDGRQDHHEVKELLEAASKETDPAKLDQRMHTLVQNLWEHMDKEEKTDLKFVADHIEASQLVERGRAFSLRKKIAPTRPHTSIPEKPAALEAVLGMLVAPMDKFKDLFTSYPDKREE